MSDHHHDHQLGDQLRRLSHWAELVPPQHRQQVAALVGRLAALLGAVVADDEEVPRG